MDTGFAIQNAGSEIAQAIRHHATMTSSIGQQSGDTMAYIIGGSILLAGLLIAGAILWVNRRSVNAAALRFGDYKDKIAA